MKKILFATGNKSKSQRFSAGLLKKGIEVLSLKDLGIKIDVDENGKNAIENAILKAKAGFEKTHMPTIGMDDNLYFEGVPDKDQPGLFVRRVNGKTLTDEEVMEHYASLVRKFGKDGKLDCKWIYGIACINEKGEIATYTWCKDNIYMVETPSKVLTPGYPLSSITKIKALDKYWTEMTKEDLDAINGNEDDVVDFIASHVK